MRRNGAIAGGNHIVDVTRITGSCRGRSLMKRGMVPFEEGCKAPRVQSRVSSKAKSLALLGLGERGSRGTALK